MNDYRRSEFNGELIASGWVDSREKKSSLGKCVICEGKVFEGEAAEMYDPIIDTVGLTDDELAVAENLAGIVHAECGIARGWRVS